MGIACVKLFIKIRILCIDFRCTDLIHSKLDNKAGVITTGNWCMSCIFQFLANINELIPVCRRIIISNLFEQIFVVPCCQEACSKRKSIYFVIKCISGCNGRIKFIKQAEIGKISYITSVYKIFQTVSLPTR